MANFAQFLSSLSPLEYERGKQFEQICHWFLSNDHFFSNKFEKLWLWEGWPDRWGRDCGIDLVGIKLIFVAAAMALAHLVPALGVLPLAIWCLGFPALMVLINFNKLRYASYK